MSIYKKPTLLTAIGGVGLNSQLKAWAGWIVAAVLAVALASVLVRQPPAQAPGQLTKSPPTGLSLPVTPRTHERALTLLELEGESKAAHKLFNQLQTQSAGNPQAQQTNHQVFDQLNAAFTELGHKAGAGDEQAFQTLFDALSMQNLQDSAAMGLGVAAGDGCEKAVDILVEPKKNGVLLSSAVGTLGPAAEKGNPKAIKFLAGITQDPANSPLWYMAATALEKPAGDGNDEAVSGLINMLDTQSDSVRGVVRSGLKRAALQGNVRARVAVSKMGW